MSPRRSCRYPLQFPMEGQNAMVLCELAIEIYETEPHQLSLQRTVVIFFLAPFKMELKGQAKSWKSFDKSLPRMIVNDSGHVL